MVDNITFGRPNRAETRLLKPVYEPKDVVRYAILGEPSRSIIYSTRGKTTKADLPSRILKHLEMFREIMEQRRENQTGQIEFFHLHWPREERFFEPGPKILAVRKCAKPTFAYTENEAYVMMAFNIIRTNRVNQLT